MKWQGRCADCNYRLQQGLPRHKVEFYAALHRANTAHRVLIHGQAEGTEGRVAVGKLA